MSTMNDDMRFNIEFVMEIERHPCLYNTKHGEYNNKPSIDRAWKLVRAKFEGLSADVVRLRWRSIRSSYSRSQRTKKEYYLAPYLKFLKPFTKTKPKEDFGETLDSDLETDNESGSQSDDASAMDMERTKFEGDLENGDDSIEYNGKIQVRTLPELKSGQGNRKFAKIKSAQSRILSQYSPFSKVTLSPSECYLKSLIPELSSMNERQFFNFRRGILNIIGKIKYATNKETTGTES